MLKFKLVSMKYYYLVCKRSIFGTLTPLKICSALDTAKKYADGVGKQCVIFKQGAEDTLELLSNKNKVSK